MARKCGGTRRARQEIVSGYFDVARLGGKKGRHGAHFAHGLGYVSVSDKATCALAVFKPRTLRALLYDGFNKGEFSGSTKRIERGGIHGMAPKNEATCLRVLASPSIA